MEHVVKNPAEQRYELTVDGELIGIADFQVVGDRVIFPHTEIVRERRGNGFGAILVRAALDDVRSTGRQVVPHCWFVAQFIDEHPEYQDLLAA
jgi:uncharacterized protein